MKLRDLDAVFLGSATEFSYSKLPDSDGAQGIMFKCPAKDHIHHIIIWFQNPRNAPKPPAALKPTTRWQWVSGDSLDDLTLAPSIDIPDDWHGFIVGGEVK